MSMYWIYVIDKVGIVSILLTIVAVVVMLVLGIGHLIKHETLEGIGKAIKPAFITFFILLAITIFTPSSEQMIKIYIVDNVVEYVEGNNNNVKELPDKVVEACNKLLDDYIADKE